MTATQLIEKYCGKEIKLCSDKEIYSGIVRTIRELCKAKQKKDTGKKLYYISAEFLIGRLLTNNLMNLGIYDEVKKLLSDCGKNIETFEEMEAEPSLGNGGLGRLASCFLDSVATLDLCGDGIGLNYHYGLFKQVFKNNMQTEEINPWLNDSGFLEQEEKKYRVDFGDFSVGARLYNLDVVGYCGRVNKLRLFDVETIDETVVGEGIDFDKTDIKKNLTLFLYPDDSDDKGRLLRVYQQYFMVSCGAQLILEECLSRGCKLYDLYDYAAIQINDTHPSMIIPELIRLLTQKGIGFDEAIDAVMKTCAYTNHTILSEALEKWELSFIKKVAPALVPVIEILDDRVRRKFDIPSVNIIDKSEIVHMANMDIHYTHSVNGVAKLHTEILKNTELNDFYRLYPEKFNNKTNGITMRRWLFQANPKLTEFIKELIGDGFMKNADELEKLGKFKADKSVLKRLRDIKSENKRNLCKYLSESQGISLNENSVFDMQIKRLHEYKRQQLNVLYLIDKYFEIKAGKTPIVPITAVFGAKAAPAYTIAKDIIHLILCFGKVVAEDKAVAPYLKIAMVENYNVSLAEKLIPACDISEQISLASKEASGTGNMKFILNGGVILGTMDGANVEIYDRVGKENIYIFGDDSETVINRYKAGSYRPKDYYEKNPSIKRAVDFITDKSMLEKGDKACLNRLKNELLSKDYFMTFPDFESYKAVRDKAISDYRKEDEWAKKMLCNISGAGYFSSDRTIEEYNDEIWHLK